MLPERAGPRETLIARADLPSCVPALVEAMLMTASPIVRKSTETVGRAMLPAIEEMFGFIGNRWNRIKL
jgi:hypothetical protein